MTQSTPDRIEKQIELRASVSRVWRAVTDYKEFGAWFRVNLESPFVLRESTRGNITHPGYEHLIMEVVVQRMEAEHLFVFQWQPCPPDPDGDDSSEPSTLVEFKLEATADGTLLHITESGFDAISAAQRNEVYHRNESGWSEQLKNIETYVRNNP